MQGARSIVANEGMGGLYSGLLPTLLRDVPEIAIQVRPSTCSAAGMAKSALLVRTCRSTDTHSPVACRQAPMSAQRECPEASYAGVFHVGVRGRSSRFTRTCGGWWSADGRSQSCAPGSTCCLAASQVPCSASSFARNVVLVVWCTWDHPLLDSLSGALKRTYL